MKLSHEVSQVGVRKALRPWSLTTLPFALALDTPHTKLVLSREGAHSPSRASGARISLRAVFLKGPRRWL